MAKLFKLFASVLFCAINYSLILAAFLLSKCPYTFVGYVVFLVLHIGFAILNSFTAKNKFQFIC